jgi:hypothetical protein
VSAARLADRAVFGIGLLAIGYVAAIWAVELQPWWPRLKGWI